MQGMSDAVRDCLEDPSQECGEIRNNLRHYNNVFSMATLGCSFGGKFSASRKWPYLMKFSGGIYHALPPIIPKVGETARFVQLYILDTVKEVLQNICATKLNKSLDVDFIKRIYTELKAKNPFIRKFKHVGDEYIKGGQCDEVCLTIQNYGGQYRAPTEDMMAAFIPDSSGNYSNKQYDKHRLILLRDSNGQNYSIHEFNGMYDPLHYPLMFPHGEFGYHQSYRYSDSKRPTVLQYYRTMFQIRPMESNPLCHYKRLYHEYAIDQWAKVERYRLNYVSNHQKDNIEHI